MRLVSFRDGDGIRIGALAVEDTKIVDFAAAARRLEPAAAPFEDMLALIDAGERGLDAVRSLTERVIAAGVGEAMVESNSVRLMAPVPLPRQMRDFLCFEQHLVDARTVRYRKLAARADDPKAEFEAYVARGVVAPPKVWYRQPIYYKCNRFSVVGTDTDVVWPRYAETLDYELEFGVFLGKRAKNVPAERARELVYGYTIFNDVSARDAQAIEMEGQLGPAKGKDFDTGNVMGPCLVTADEIADPYALSMTAKVNGELWSRGHSGSMGWKFEQLIEWVSQDETLHPGEFLGSGTVGSGCGLELDRWLKPGDVVELEVEKIGRLRNRIVKPN